MSSQCPHHDADKLPKVPGSSFALSQRCRITEKCLGMIKTVTGIFREYAERLRIYEICFPRLVHALVDARLKRTYRGRTAHCRMGGEGAGLQVLNEV